MKKRNTLHLRMKKPSLARAASDDVKPQSLYRRYMLELRPEWGGDDEDPVNEILFRLALIAVDLMNDELYQVEVTSKETIKEGEK